MTTQIGEQEKVPGHENAAAIDGGRTDEDQQPLGRDNIGREHAQRGVKQVEAITAAWSKKSLLVAYAG
jgi:hypothetical protein